MVMHTQGAGAYKQVLVKTDMTLSQRHGVAALAAVVSCSWTELRLAPVTRVIEASRTNVAEAEATLMAMERIATLSNLHHHQVLFITDALSVWRYLNRGPATHGEEKLDLAPLTERIKGYLERWRTWRYEYRPRSDLYEADALATVVMKAWRAGHQAGVAAPRPEEQNPATSPRTFRPA